MQTARLSMYELQAADQELFCELFTDEETMKFIGPPLSPAKARRAFEAAVRINAALPRQGLFLRVADEPSLQPIGICSVHGLDARQRRAEAGLILNRAGRARGLGAEALSALVSYAFRLFAIEETWVQYRAGHLAAERLVMIAGLMPGDHVGADGRSAEQRVWSAFRRSWGHERLPINSGEHTCRM